MSAPAFAHEQRASQMSVRAAQPSESRALIEWVGERHYLGDVPGCIVAMEFLLGGVLIGAAIYGRPNARAYAGPGYDVQRTIQLTRLYFVDNTPEHVESRGLALSRKHVRTWFPSVKLLLSYSDPSQGHEGQIYAADGWAPFGLTKGEGHSFQSRPGRKAGSGARKQRWVRTP